MERIVNTHIKATQRNLDIMRSVIGQMSDGIWENATCLNGYWAFANIVELDNSLIGIAVDATSGKWAYDYSRFLKNRWWRMSDAQILKFFANKIKQIADIEISDCHYDKKSTWAYNNNEVSDYLDYDSGVTFGDAFILKRTLMAEVRGMA